MKKGRFLWSAHRITERQKAGKARSIKEKQLKNSRSTVSKQLVALRSSASADLFQMYLYGSASAEPFFVACFPGELGSTTAHLRRLPRKGRAGGAYKSLLKHRVQGAALPAMLPSSPSADYISDATLRLCFGRAVFCCLLFRRTGEHDCASPAVAPQGASRRRF